MLAASFIAVASVLSLVRGSTLRASRCPPDSATRPCLCLSSSYPVLICESVNDAEMIRRVFSQSEDYHYKVVDFRFANLQFLPHIMFSDPSMKKLVLKNVTLTELFDQPPSNLSHMESIHIESTNIGSGILWQAMEPFSHLKVLNIYYKQIGALTMDFSTYVSHSLRQVCFYATDTETIEAGVFHEFQDLDKVSFDHCKLTEIRRDMFPAPFNARFLYFNDARLSTIPDDMFTEMPNLQTVSMTGNLLSVIPEPAFLGRLADLTHLFLDGNHLKCDCRMKWLAEDAPETLTGVCSSPKSLHGVQLEDLTSNDFNHC